MFVAVYQWKLKPGREEEFRRAWVKATVKNYRIKGSLGSRLHRNVDGTWVATAQWPSRAHWESAWKSGDPADPEGSAIMSDCAEPDYADAQRRPILFMEIMEDMFYPEPYKPDPPP
jgi:heme-degrading monooxygenase HmoA